MSTTFFGVLHRLILEMVGSSWQNSNSFLSHVVDKHDELDDPLYNKCAHGELTPRKWILPGMYNFIQ